MTMTRFWNELEGVSLAGRYRLEQCLSASESDAWYLTRLEDGRPAAMRVMPDHSLQTAQQLSAWQAAMGFDHPHLVRMLDAGRATADGTPLIFAVCEYPDDFLAAVLEERPLSAAEARDLLVAALDALRFVHERGFVHTAVDPAHIMAFGDRVKLPSDSLQRGGLRAPSAGSGPYDPPEAASGTVSPAGDLWTLGIMLHEVLTQHRPNLARDAEFLYLAEPFATILRHCLKAEPGERWTLGDIENCLRPAPPVPVPAKSEPLPALPVPVAAKVAPVRTERTPVPPEPARPLSSRGFPVGWVPVVGVVAALALSAVLLRKPEAHAPAPTPAPVAPAARAVEPTEAAPARRPSPLPAKPTATGAWRVVAWTYATRQAAEKKVHSLNRQAPEWKAQVFAPNGDRQPYFVALGGRMSRAEALQLQQKARARGLPGDTFARNFSK
jgi:eukaryotic-like serine/threonine-protein kinase